MSSSKPQSRGLGRGLSALMSDVPAPDTDMITERTVPVEQIYPNPDQPRRSFDEAALDDLAASISEKGIIQPLIVRKRDRADSSFEIVAGERRWRAAQRAKLHEVPVIVREFSDLEVLEVAIIENIQRSDLNPVDEAAGYKQLIEKFGRTQEEMGKALGKSRSHIANSIRLLSLPESIQNDLANGKLSAGHARTLVNHPNAEELAEQIIRNGLSVRDAEKLAKRGGATTSKPGRAKAPSKDADTVQIENELAAQLGMKVTVNHADGKDHGTVYLHYRSLEQLDDLLRLLSGS